MSHPEFSDPDHEGLDFVRRQREQANKKALDRIVGKALDKMGVNRELTPEQQAIERRANETVEQLRERRIIRRVWPKEGFKFVEEEVLGVDHLDRTDRGHIWFTTGMIASYPAERPRPNGADHDNYVLDIVEQFEAPFVYPIGDNPDEAMLNVVLRHYAQASNPELDGEYGIDMLDLRVGTPPAEDDLPRMNTIYFPDGDARVGFLQKAIDAVDYNQDPSKYFSMLTEGNQYVAGREHWNAVSEQSPY